MKTNILENNKFTLPGTKYNLQVASKYTFQEIKTDFYVLSYFNITLIYLYPQVFHFAFHLDNTQDFLALARPVTLAEGQAEHLLIWLVI